MFQDGSVKTILTGSHEAPSGHAATGTTGLPHEWDQLPTGLCDHVTPSGLTTEH